MQNVRKSLGNGGFEVVMDAEDNAKSQKFDLKWTSVWSAKCKEFLRKWKV